MSLEIKITDPDRMQPSQLESIIRFIVAYSGFKIVVDNGATIAAHTHNAISDDDRPDTGSPSPSEVFGKTGTDEPSPAAVFGGNGAPATAGAATSTTAPAGTTAISTSTNGPSPNAAPPAPPAGTVAPGTASHVETDKNGLPHDTRIHSESRAKNVDGTWRRRKNITDEFFNEVAAQLRAVMGNGSSGVASSVGSPVPLPPVLSVAAPPAPPVATVGASSPNAAPPAPAALPATLQAVAAPPAPVDAGNVAAPPPPPPGPQLSTVAPSVQVGESQDSAPSAMTFADVCRRVVDAINGNRTTNEKLGEVLGKYNVSGLPTLAAFPNLWATVVTELGV